MITVYGRATSSNVQAVMWTIGELGLEYERLNYGHRFGGTDTSEFRAMNPNGLVPVIRDGQEAPLFESAAIVRYLASRYGDDSFWPKDVSARAHVDMWATWAKVEVARAFTMPIFWPMVRVPAAERDEAAFAAAVTQLGNLLTVAESQLCHHAFLASDRLTVADIQLGHLLYRYFDITIERPELPALAAYHKRLTERPAFREHVMVSYDELRTK